jgi:hypothetical protein
MVTPSHASPGEFKTEYQVVAVVIDSLQQNAGIHLPFARLSVAVAFIMAGVMCPVSSLPWSWAAVHIIDFIEAQGQPLSYYTNRAPIEGVWQCALCAAPGWREPQQRHRAKFEDDLRDAGFKN